MDDVSFIDSIRRRASIRTLYLPHAVRQMARPDRMITTAEVQAVIKYGRLIEEYPGDARGHSALLLGHGAGQRPIHVVCSPKEEYLAIITAYVPDVDEWSPDFSMRIVR